MVVTLLQTRGFRESDRGNKNANSALTNEANCGQFYNVPVEETWSDSGTSEVKGIFTSALLPASGRQTEEKSEK